MAAWDGQSHVYVSAHSADVILSDIRPVKLKTDALNSINALLDELLYNIIKSASSLRTDRLRAGLLSILPTSVGKEALLEAEVELRAYWDRAKTKPTSADDDRSNFNFQWAFELLRLKCTAWSTLNEADEDPTAESLLLDKFSAQASQMPKQVLVAPAALYLTAIIEAVCEHVLSNVGRVASRDSSRTSATVQDLFTALCEDDAVYGLFKTMQIYNQIEELSKPPRAHQGPRRTKSFTRSDVSRTGSPHQEPLPTRESATTPVNQRQSSEGTLAAPATVSSRSSIEKKGMKKFMPSGRSSHDSDSNHRRTDSNLGENAKRSRTAMSGHGRQSSDASAQDFDDLMRSGSTMKVSLTPDRLRTMEVYKQEKDRHAVISPLSLSSQQEAEPGPVTSSRPSNSRRPSQIRQVDSIDESEEAPRTSSNTSRTAPVPSLSTAPSAASRLRSHSTASSKNYRPRKESKSSITAPPVSYTPPVPDREMSRGLSGDFNSNPFPTKTRKITRNRESLDLDDVMAGSEEEGLEDAASSSPAKSVMSSPQPPVRAPKVSMRTRELMDFLNEGPPSEGPSFARPDFVSPSTADLPPIEQSKGGRSGRLQRMMSKLSLVGDKGRPQDDFRSTGSPRPQVVTKSTSYSSLPHKGSMPSLANNPVPPRPPFVSPPQSPVTDDQYSSSRIRNNPSFTRSPPARATETIIPPSPSQPPPEPKAATKAESGLSKQTSVEQLPNQRGLSRNGQPAEPVTRPQRRNTYQSIDDGHAPEPRQSRVPPPSATKPGVTALSISPQAKSPPTPPPRSPARAAQALPSVSPKSETEEKVTDKSDVKPEVSANVLAESGVELRRLLSRATSAEECRLLVESFFSRTAGVPVNGADYDIPYPSPSPSVHKDMKIEPAISEKALENAVVELLLAGDCTLPISRPLPSPTPSSMMPQQKSYVTRKKVPDLTPTAANANGNGTPAVPVAGASRRGTVSYPESKTRPIPSASVVMRTRT